MFHKDLSSEVISMTGVYVGVSVFFVMASVAVIAAIVAAVSAVVGFSKPEDCDE